PLAQPARLTSGSSWSSLIRGGETVPPPSEGTCFIKAPSFDQEKGAPATLPAGAPRSATACHGGNMPLVGALAPIQNFVSIDRRFGITEQLSRILRRCISFVPRIR